MSKKLRLNFFDRVKVFTLIISKIRNFPRYTLWSVYPSPTSIDISKENCEEYGYEYNKALFYIQNHIDRFCLNGERFSECIIDICSDIVFLWENGFSEISAFWDYYQDKVLDNIIGSLFVEYLKEHFNDLSKMIEYCRLIVLLYSIC